MVDKYAPHIERTNGKNTVTLTIVIYEVYKRMRRERGAHMEEDERLTARKRGILSLKAKRQDSAPSDIRQLAEDLVGDITVLERYPVGFNQEFEGRLT